MYGKSVYARNKGYWAAYDQSLAGLVTRSAATLEELALEPPARCLGRGVVRR